jgi:hypothetical protein
VIPTEGTILVIEHELEGAMAWSKRHAIPLLWLPGALELRAAFTQPETNEQFFLKATFPDYKELPPLITFTSNDWQQPPTKSLFPKPLPGSPPWGSYVFIQHAGKPVICVPFNRLAYGQLAGPHVDWRDPAQWQTVAPQHVRAVEIADMLQVMARDIGCTKGRME